MRTSNFKKILYFFIFILIFIPSFSSAQSGDTSITLPANSNATPQPNTGGFTYTSLVKLPGLGNDGVVTISPDSLGSYLQTVFNYVIGISIFLATVVVVYGGFLYATTDAISTKQEGKKIIQDAFIGLGLALSSWLILYTINPDLLKFDLSIERASLPTGTDGGTGSLVAIQSGGGMTPSGGGSGNNCQSVPASELTTIDGFQLKKSVADRYTSMKSAAASDGVTLNLSSGYRSPARQLEIWNQYGCRLVNGRAVCSNGKKVAIPCALGGRGSNHSSGEAVDISVGCSNGQTSCGTRTYRWLKQNGGRFNFYNNVPADPVHWSPTGK